MVLAPLKARHKQIKAQLAAAIMEHDLTSTPVDDAKALLQEVVAQIDDATQKYKKLIAQMKAKHMSQEDERGASEQYARDTRVMRGPAPSSGASSSTDALPRAPPNPNQRPLPAPAPAPAPAPVPAPAPAPEPAPATTPDPLAAFSF